MRQCENLTRSPLEMNNGLEEERRVLLCLELNISDPCHKALTSLMTPVQSNYRNVSSSQQ